MTARITVTGGFYWAFSWNATDHKWQQLSNRKMSLIIAAFSEFSTARGHNWPVAQQPSADNQTWTKWAQLFKVLICVVSAAAAVY